MSPKIVSLLVVATMAIMACAVAVPSADAVQSDGYVSQLDDNGVGLYRHIEGRFVIGDDAVPQTISVVYALDRPVLFDDVDSARAYAGSMVKDVLSAMYLTDPNHIWLWDYPVKDVGVDVVTVNVNVHPDRYVSPTSVSFVLDVPEAYRDDPGTEVDETLEAIRAVDSAVKTFEGTLYDKVRGIDDMLRGIKVVEDEEGKVGNIHDALVKRSSSTAGIAAAFTHLCGANAIGAVTVQGSVLGGEDFVQAYWNVVRDGESWFAVDTTWDSNIEKNCLLVGMTSSVVHNGVTYGFGSTHVPDMASMPSKGLVAPQVAMDGYEWPDERSFIMKNGVSIAMTAITLLIVLAIVLAIRSDNV